MVLEYETLQEGYAEICKHVLLHGTESSPRGLKTKELIAPTIYLNRPDMALPTEIGRGVSLKVAAVEAVQLVGAFHDPELMVAASDAFEKFREPYTRQMWGAYGRRIGTQAANVAHKLKQDPDSRQAVITLWDPGVDNIPGKKDYPCTVSLQFLIREDALHCVTNMRSNDVWLGLAYDLFQFGQLQWTIAHMLEIPAGTLVHRPVSLHAYEHNWEAIENLESGEERYPPPKLYGFRDLMFAKRIGYNRVGDDEGLSHTEAWYTEQLAPLFERKRDALRRQASD